MFSCSLECTGANSMSNRIRFSQHQLLSLEESYMRRILTVLGATVVGLIGILTLYPRSKTPYPLSDRVIHKARPEYQLMGER